MAWKKPKFDKLNELVEKLKELNEANISIDKKKLDNLKKILEIQLKRKNELDQK